MSSMKFDIAVIGAGPIGMLSAIAMHEIGFKVAVITDRVNTDAGKIFSVNCTSFDFIKSLNVNITNDVGNISRIRVEGKGEGFVLNENDAASIPVAYVIPSEVLSSVLLKSCQTRSIHMIEGVSILNIDEEVITYEKKDQSGRIAKNQINSDLILACDGHNSQVRDNFTDVNKTIKEYNQYATSYIVTHREIDNVEASEVFLDNGAMIAGIPISDMESCVIWTRDNCNNIGPELKHIIHEIEDIRKISEYRLKGMIVDKLNFGHIILMGSSNCVLHPVAGQGLNLGIRDIFVLFNALKRSKECGIRVYDKHTIQKFNKARISDIKKIWIATNIIIKMFAANALTIPIYYGNKVINNCAPLRRYFIKDAIGAKVYRG